MLGSARRANERAENSSKSIQKSIPNQDWAIILMGGKLHFGAVSGVWAGSHFQMRLGKRFGWLLNNFRKTVWLQLSLQQYVNVNGTANVNVNANTNTHVN